MRLQLVWGAHLLTCMLWKACDAAPLRLHPTNPRYFLWDGKPLALITSTEHFGAVINEKFDYLEYLDTLASNGFTLTQAWTGAYVEPESDAGIYNTLDPAAGNFIAPWARSDVPGNAKGGNKFDLTAFNTSFFDRLSSFVHAAAVRGIIVEVGLFGGYEQNHESIWQVTPFHPSNNINVRPGSVNRSTVYSLAAPAALRSAQIETARRIAHCLRSFDNLYYQLINVPNHSSPAWGTFIRDAVIAADPGKLIAVPVEWAQQGFVHNVSVLNFRSVARPSNVTEAPLTAAALAYDETGGGVIDNLDWSFAVGHENGSLAADKCHGPLTSGATIRQQLATLSRFFHTLPFPFMRPDVAWIFKVTPPTPGIVQGFRLVDAQEDRRAQQLSGLKPQLVAEEDSTRKDEGIRRGDSGTPSASAPALRAVLGAAFLASAGLRSIDVDSARFRASCEGSSFAIEWVDTQTGEQIGMQMGQTVGEVELQGGNSTIIRFAVPAYEDDIAFRLLCDGSATALA